MLHITTATTYFLKNQMVSRARCNDPDIAVLFQDMSPASLQELVASSRIQHFPAGVMLLCQGDVPDYLYCILSGKVSTSRRDRYGDGAIIRMLSKGDTFMDAAIFMEGNSPVGVAILQDSFILMIPKQIIHRLANYDPRLSNNLAKIITRHYKNSVRQIDSLLTKASVNRIGYYFLQLYLSGKQKSLTIDLPFQKATIANHLGMTPETFSRALNQIKRRGVRASKSRIMLQDPYVLCEFCDGDTAKQCPHFNMEKCAHCTMDKKSH